MMKPSERESKAPTGESKPLAELLSGTAFLAHPMDAAVPLKERFAGKSVLLLMTTRDRAATLRVEVGVKGQLQMASPRQIAQRSKGELVSVLRAEARACGANWVVISLGSGWQAQYAPRSLRGGSSLEEGPRELLLREDPGQFVAKPQADSLYAAVDHPVLDRSLVFSVKRRELESLAEDVREAGLGLASVRLGMASMLEAWFRRRGAAACQQDLLLSDGLGVALLAFERGDFMAPAELGSEGGGAPRQYSNRPGDIAQDLTRLFRDNAGRPLSYVGPLELEPRNGESKAMGVVESQRLDPAEATFDEGARHEFHPHLEARRPALARRVRRQCQLACLTAALACVLAVAAFVDVWVTGEQKAELEANSRRQGQQELANLKRCAEMGAQRTQALEYLQWLRTHPDGQRLLLRLLEGLPETVALERLSAQVDETGRQLALEFHLLGGEEGQSLALRSVEQALLGLGYRIGERSPATQAHRGTLHRWRLIVPPAFEEASS